MYIRNIFQFKNILFLMVILIKIMNDIEMHKMCNYPHLLGVEANLIIILSITKQRGHITINS